jgi:hypothetical protein
MTNKPEPERKTLDPEMVRGLAAAAGVPLTDDRAAALVAQAEAHFALLHALASTANPSSEPAALFHLDRWAKPAHD